MFFSKIMIFSKFKYAIFLFLCVHLISGCTHLTKQKCCDHVPHDVLYHGSNNSDLKKIVPRQIHYRDINEGAKIFATPSMAVASCYLFRWDDSWVRQRVLHSTTHIASRVLMIINHQEYARKNADHGGSIYILPPDSFEVNPEKSLGIYEAVSSIPVVPYAKIDFDSALNAMITFNVDVYFVNNSQFKDISSLSSADWINYLDRQKIKPLVF